MTHEPAYPAEKTAEPRQVAPDAVAVITVNWNGWENTLKCLAALRHSTGASWHLFIVDNGSTDGSFSHLRDLGRDVTLIDAGANLGWTGGNNLGAREALRLGYDYIFLLNNDAFVESDTIATLLAVSQGSSGPAPVLGAVHRGVGSRDYDFSHAEIDRKTGIPHWVQAEPAPLTALHETAYISGAALFAKAEHFRAVGLIDDRMFLNFDDTDWCRRASKKGFPLLMVRDAVVHHEGSASIGGRDAPLQTYFMTRNRLLYAERHATPLQRLRLVRRYVWQARDLAGGKGLLSLLRADGGSRAAFRRGILDYLARRFGDCPSVVRTWQAQASQERRREGGRDAS